MQQLPTGLSDLPSYLIYLLLNPTFNLTAALILYATIVVFLLLIMVVGILLLTRRRRHGELAEEQPPAEDEEFAQLASGEAYEGRDEEPVQPEKQREPRVKKVRKPMSPVARLLFGVSGAVLLIAAWVVTGATTSSPSLCKDCHWPAARHASAAEGTDPHADTACISCHESGSLTERYITGVPARVMHLVDVNSEKPRFEYGAITTAACSRCHEAKLEGVVSNEARGLKMSHKEPLEASASCIDCHALRAGVVGTHNAGMTPCLRCHDSAAQSASCEVCHDTKTASAARARTSTFTKEQITDLSCGGCHDEASQCDPCHGLRMPHSNEFKIYAHARAGAVDFWYNNGATCGKCHTATRRQCQKCHSSILGTAHGKGKTSWLPRGHSAAQSPACDSCHRLNAYTSTRDFCTDICHTPAAIASSPR